MAHKWTEKEEQICVEAVFKKYVDCVSFDAFLEMLSNKMPQIPKRSIKMKIRNIKWLLNERGILNLLPTTALSHRSQQGKEVFDKVVNKRRQKKELRDA